MSANPHRAGGWITVDWTIIALSLLAVGLLLATTIRTDRVRLGAAADAAEGFHVLTAEERLVAFEDFSFGTHGWTIASAEPSDETAPSILGPFRRGSLEKSYALPPGTRRAVLTLDLYLSGREAAEALSVEVNGTPVLRGLAPSAESDAIVASVRAPDVAGPRNPWTIRIAVADPGAEVALGLHDAEGGRGGWGLDNVWVVAESAGRAP
ncbi:MAG: hypothetical protein ACOCTP_03210 [Roseicyclus sp.]